MFDFKLQNISDFPFIFFVGETGLQYEELLAQVRIEIKKQVANCEEIKWDASNTAVDAVQESVLSLGLFSSFKLICLNEGQKWNLKKWEEFYKKCPSQISAILFIQFSKKDKLAEIQKFFLGRFQHFEEQKIYARHLPQILGRYLEQKKISMTQEAILFLIHQLGEDLSILKLAIDRLEIDLPHLKAIDFPEVQAIFEQNKTLSLFDCFSAGQQLHLDELFKKVDLLLGQGEAAISVFSQALRTQRILGKLKYALQKKMGQPEIQKKMGLPSFILDQYKTSAQKLSWQSWMKNYQLMSQTDLSLKSSSISDEQILKNFLFKLEN